MAALRWTRLKVQPVPWLCAAAVIAATSPEILREYAYKDDYSLLWQHLHHKGTAAFAVSQGRPVAALLQSAGWLVVKQVTNFWILRLAAVLLLAGAVLALSRALLRWGYSAAAVLIAVGLFMALPSTVMMTSWASFFFAAFAILLSVVSAVWLSLAGELAAGSGGRRARYAASFLLLTLAVLTYQPAAMSFFPVLLLFAASPGRRGSDLADDLRLLVRAAAVALPALIAGYLAVRLSTLFVGSTSSRSALSHDPIGKLDFFVKSVVRFSFFPWNVTGRPRAGEAVAVLLTLCMPFVVGGRLPRRLVLAALAIATVALGWLASWPIAENTDAIRTAMSVMLAMVAMWTLVVQAVAERLSRLKPALAVMVAVGIAVLVVGGVRLGQNIASYVQRPSAEEWARVKATVRQIPDNAHITVLPSLCDSTLAPRLIGDELGVPSTCVYWADESLTELAYRQTRGSWPPAGDFVFKGDADYAAGRLRVLPAKGAMVLDYERVLRSQAKPVFPVS